jgi:hypothetical protein
MEIPIVTHEVCRDIESKISTESICSVQLFVRFNLECRLEFVKQFTFNIKGKALKLKWLEKVKIFLESNSLEIVLKLIFESFCFLKKSSQTHNKTQSPYVELKYTKR